MWDSFASLWPKCLTKTTLEGKFILAHESAVQFTAGQVHCSGSKMKQNIMVEGRGGGALLHSWQPRKLEVVAQRRWTILEHALSNPLSLARPHLPTVIAQSIQTRIDRLGYSSHNPIYFTSNIPVLTQEFGDTSYPKHSNIQVYLLPLFIVIIYSGMWVTYNIFIFTCKNEQFL